MLSKTIDTKVKPNMLIIAEDKWPIETIVLFQDFRITFASSLDEAKFLLERFKYHLIYCEPSREIPNCRGEFFSSYRAKIRNQYSDFVFNCKKPPLAEPLRHTFYYCDSNRIIAIRNCLLRERSSSVGFSLKK